MGTRNFHWDPIDDCVTMETEENGGTLATFTSEPGQFGPLLSESRSNTEFYHHYDALGSTTMLTNDAGSVTDTFLFDSSGTVVARTGTTPTPYQWVGRMGYHFGLETQRYYVRYRSFDSAIARWESLDPLGFFDGPNRYSAKINPATIDPSGTVTKYYSPANATNMPWCQVGRSEGTDRDETPDPDGLKPGIYGTTDPLQFNVECVCDCCKPGCGKLRCAVYSYLKVRISPRNMRSSSHTTDGAYGHEQKHVKNLIKCADEVAKALEDLEKFSKCDRLCSEIAKRMQEFLNEVMQACVNQEANHKNPEPIEGHDYQPTGRRPKSDCSKPPTPPTFPPRKPCKDEV